MFDQFLSSLLCANKNYTISHHMKWLLSLAKDSSPRGIADEGTLKKVLTIGKRFTQSTVLGTGNGYLKILGWDFLN